MELQENAGKVNRGYSKQVIRRLKPIMWTRGSTKENACSICFEDFQVGSKVKELKCGHAYH